MTTTYTPNRNYALPGTGDDVNAWASVINANFSAIDTNISGRIVISTTGGTTTLTSGQAANIFFAVAGALTSNATIVYPITAGLFSVVNLTSGAFTLTISCAGAGQSQVITQAQAAVFYCDGTNIFDVANNTPTTPSFPSGTVLQFLQSAAPTGWTQSTSFNDAVIRVVNDGSGGGVGGSWTISGITIGGTALTTDNLPSHYHVFGTTRGTAGGSGTSGVVPVAGTGVNTSSVGNGTTHTHSFAADGTWRPAYVNALVATKN